MYEANDDDGAGFRYRLKFSSPVRVSDVIT